MDCLKNLARVIAVLHDAGKLRPEFQQYMEEILEKGEEAYRQQIDHATAGGRIAENIAGNVLVSKIVATAVYSHHGLQDCIDMSTGKTLSEIRRERDISFEMAEERYFSICDKEVLTEWLLKAHHEVKKIQQDIKAMTVRYGEKGKYGNTDFFLGMYERLLISVLIDSDWTDSASFSEDRTLPERMTKEQIKGIWAEMILNFDSHMDSLILEKEKSLLDGYRHEISDLCYQASRFRERLYRLTVPTGAGKTLSSLRFALHHAKEFEKQHIFYVAPFNSILEQNAEEIRKAVGSEGNVLEHHCNVVYEDEKQQQNYKKLTERWDCPVIVTTAVQMLNTLFSGQKSSIRRMYNLCNSVIIFDEVQAFPLKCTELFSLAVNFLTEFCNTTVVLCSATQPSLAEREENNILRCWEMAGDIHQYMEAFRRVEIEDTRDLIPGGMSIEQAARFTLDSIEDRDSVLVIMNTKTAAKNLYEALKKEGGDAYELYHLSANMCPEHRSDKLNEIRKILKDKKNVPNKKKLICVSTQLIEAGVDVSFGCVIRALAGLDSIIQAAGRCNRHKENDKLGKVYIIQMSKEAERLGKPLYEIRQAQRACEKLLDEFKQEPEQFQGSLDSQYSVRGYYRLLYHELDKDETKYPVEIEDGVGTNLIDLLGKNTLGIMQYRRSHKEACMKRPLNQAFKTAGEKFEVIPEDGKITVVVPYNEKAEGDIAKLKKGGQTISEQKMILRRLQRFTVGISERTKDKLEGTKAINCISEGSILVLNKDYYSSETGVKETLNK